LYQFLTEFFCRDPAGGSRASQSVARAWLIPY